MRFLLATALACVLLLTCLEQVDARQGQGTPPCDHVRGDCVAVACQDTGFPVTEFQCTIQGEAWGSEWKMIYQFQTTGTAPTGVYEPVSNRYLCQQSVPPYGNYYTNRCLDIYASSQQYGINCTVLTGVGGNPGLKACQSEG